MCREYLSIYCVKKRQPSRSQATLYLKCNHTKWVTLFSYICIHLYNIIVNPIDSRHSFECTVIRGWRHIHLVCRSNRNNKLLSNACSLYLSFSFRNIERTFHRTRLSCKKITTTTTKKTFIDEKKPRKCGTRTAPHFTQFKKLINLCKSEYRDLQLILALTVYWIICAPSARLAITTMNETTRYDTMYGIYVSPSVANVGGGHELITFSYSHSLHCGAIFISVSVIRRLIYGYVLIILISQCYTEIFTLK